ncbi:hypothetical protein CBR_g36558 [Chara braunii]|uniref:glutathione-disulfide reductase n=1 Tax=Chara braunii TaxID=69332 RepID=A0A388JZE4_CHABU|nr:hypothetical protein CBR_g36558 [Chara braunii]|eukprot:GBG63073.1 hypothetical protein CBR_g36558 [Chara braunii]
MERQALSAMVGGNGLKLGGACAAARTLIYSARTIWSQSSSSISGSSSSLPSRRWAVYLVSYARGHSDTTARVSSSSSSDSLPSIPGGFRGLRAAPLKTGAGAQRCAGADIGADEDHFFDRRPSWGRLSSRSPRGCRRDRRSGGGGWIRCHVSSSGHSAGDGATNGASSSSSSSQETNYDYDVLTIGAGSGGVRASRFVAGFGAKVAVCELPFALTSSDSKGGVGGTCVIRGCVPKKLLVYGSQFAHEFLASKGFGWSFDKEPSHDWVTLIDNKNKEIQRLTGVYRKLLDGSKVDLLEGRAKLVGPHTVEVGSKRYTAKNILLAVGGRPFVPDIPGKEYGITSDEALELPERPQSICIIGGGYIALEFASIFNALGTETHVLIRQPKVLRGFDEEIRDFLGEQLQTRGIKIHNRASPVSVEKDADTGKLVLTTDKGEKITTEVVMFATGRKPRTERLGAEEVGVELDSSGAIKCLYVIRL